ncbi:ATP-binding protein [Nonomuraea ceibae]|uniref:ATP-binding protein n=1 Tax=Nonomuraea ceibae TaxID=1935170 RepID=UPI002484800B|nr:helix-turn-helix domain-containing protein [Nonomuraea ceibae]
MVSSFGLLLRRLRQRATLTLEELADVSGVSARAISDMERGNSRGPQQRTVDALAKALQLDDEQRSALTEAARAGRYRPTSPPPGACELPRGVDDFTGRWPELDVLRRLAGQAGTGHAALVAAISGSAGVGKTALAVHAAGQLTEVFPGGRYYVDLRGMDAVPLNPGAALSRLLKALSVPEQRIAGDEEERAGHYRALLRERRCLIVLDNAAHEAQVRPLLPSGGPSLTIVTSRKVLAGLEGVHQVPLANLDAADSARLLGAIVGAQRAAADSDSVAQVARLCGNLPLALRIAGNRLLTRPGWTIEHLAARLSDEERRVESLSAGDLSVAAAFALSYRQLSLPARVGFRRLTLVTAPDFGVPLTAVLAETGLDQAEDALEELVDLGLLQSAYAGRYHFHDLVRLFSRARLAEEEPITLQRQARQRMDDWLLETATVAGRWFEPDHGAPPAQWQSLVPLGSQQEASDWLQAEATAWLEALRSAARQGEHATVVEVAESMYWFSDRWMHAPHWHEVFALGAEAAAALGDPARQARQLNQVAWAHLVPGDDPETALRYTAQVVELATRSAATAQLASAHHAAGGALRRLGRLDEAIAAETRAAEIFKAGGNIDAYSQCLGALGTCLRDAGQYPEALEQYLGLWALLDDDQSGMTPSAAAFTRPIALARIGECLGLLGHRSEAISKLTEAISLMEQARLPAPQARSLETLAAFLAEEGRSGESRQAYARAAEVYQAIGHAEASARCHDLATMSPDGQ